jgi:hypothetical protein
MKSVKWQMTNLKQEIMGIIAMEIGHRMKKVKAMEMGLKLE